MPTVRARKGMGFKAAAKVVAKKAGVSEAEGAAIVAKTTRGASPAAKKANPNLKKVLPKKAAPKKVAKKATMPKSTKSVGY